MLNALHLRSALIVGASAVALSSVASPAWSQNVIQELVVTAQKREEALQDVPIAVSAFNQDTLEKAKIDGGPNLVIAVPNVNFSKGNFTGYNFQIRGIGSKLVAGSGDAGTGIHLNNAPLLSNNLFETEFYDVERVEVLRGPQGTLYGRNATGGVVNMITAKPIDEFEAMIRGEVGNYNTMKLRGMINVPLGDQFALRVAGSWLKRDGFGDNLVTGNDADDRDLFGTRVTLAFNPTDTFHAYFLWDHFDEDDNRSRIGKQFCTKDLGPSNVGGLGYFRAGIVAPFIASGRLFPVQEAPVFSHAASVVYAAQDDRELLARARQGLRAAAADAGRGGSWNACSPGSPMRVAATPVFDQNA